MNLSLEIFPPRYGEPLGDTKELIADIAKLKPEFLSITYRATEGYCQGTFDCTKYAIERGIRTIPHITSCALTKETFRKILSDINTAGAYEFLALSGDPLPTGDFKQCTDMLKHYSTLRPWQGIPKPMAACYPEKHPRGLNYQTEIEVMKMKQDYGVTDFISQLFYDNNAFYRFLNRVHRANIDTPIHAGIMPCLKASQIRRIVELSHAFFPRQFEEIIDKWGSDPKSMRQAGMAYAISQIVDLKANGIEHIHLYMMNDITIVRDIINQIGALL